MNNKGARTFLYIIFILLIIASGAIFYYILTNPTQKIIYIEPEQEPDISVIEVDETKKHTIRIDADEVVMSPDVDIAQERINHHNNDIIGRLELPNMFNILIVRGSDNKKYLEANIEGEYEYRGSSFMDYRVGPDSKQINIYGHNSRDVNIQVPFMKLEQFLDKSYFDANPYIIFQYENGKKVYRIAAITEVYNNNLEHMRVNKTGADYVNHVRELLSSPINSRAVTVNENTNIIVLQTCSHHWDNAVYLITGVQIDYVEGY